MGDHHDGDPVLAAVGAQQRDDRSGGDPAYVNRLVTEALDCHRVPPDDSHVVARASGNTVMLGGRVRTRAQRDAVVAAAWQGHAVMAVIDELEITG